MKVPKLNDVSNKFKNTLNILTQNVSKNVNVGNFYKVLKFYPDGPSADIISLVDDSEGIDKAVKINRCPVLETALIKLHMNEPDPDKHKHTPYYYPLEPGDKVFVVFNNVDLDEFDGEKIKKSSERRHSINDAVIIGRYKSKRLEW